MSRLVQTRRGGKSATPVAGSLSGTGSLSIPQGTGLVSLLGKGGNGGDNSWYDPGQPYIAPTYVNTWSGSLTSATYVNGVNTAADYWPDIYSGTGPTPSNSFTGSTGGPGSGTTYTEERSYYSTGSTMTNPGQPYIAPSSGGGPYSGISTTATLNGVTRTWNGGYGSGGVGTQSTQTLESNGAGQTLSYSVPGTGSLSYTYEY